MAKRNLRAERASLVARIKEIAGRIDVAHGGQKGKIYGAASRFSRPVRSTSKPSWRPACSACAGAVDAWPVTATTSKPRARASMSGRRLAGSSPLGGDHRGRRRGPGLLLTASGAAAAGAGAGSASSSLATSRRVGGRGVSRSARRYRRISAGPPGPAATSSHDTRRWRGSGSRRPCPSLASLPGRGRRQARRAAWSWRPSVRTVEHPCVPVDRARNGHGRQRSNRTNATTVLT